MLTCEQGEAVFIPPGCVHQVSNLTTCIKVAKDYVPAFSFSSTRALVPLAREWVMDVKGKKREERRAGWSVLKLKLHAMAFHALPHFQKMLASTAAT